MVCFFFKNYLELRESLRSIKFTNFNLINAIPSFINLSQNYKKNYLLTLVTNTTFSLVRAFSLISLHDTRNALKISSRKI